MRLIKCKRCGRIIETDKQKAYCDDCRSAIKRESVLRERTCASCGIAFVGYPRSKYCPDCQRERDKAADRAHYNRARRGETRKIGSEAICEVCGKPYTVWSGGQKYCPDCAPDAVSENVRVHKRAYMADRTEENQASKVRLRTDRKVCVVCGNTFTAQDPNVTCSPVCAKKFMHKQQQKYYKQLGIPERVLKPPKDELMSQTIWLLDIRAEQGISQKRAAEICGVSKDTWNRWERGQQRISQEYQDRIKEKIEK